MLILPQSSHIDKLSSDGINAFSQQNLVGSPLGSAQIEEVTHLDKTSWSGYP